MRKFKVRTARRFPVVATILVVSCFIGATLGYAQSKPIDRKFDCVINPKSMVQLGTAVEGVVTEVLVQRGDVVKKGDVIARLDSTLEALQTELMGIRANNKIEFVSAKRRLDFRQQEYNRIMELHRRKVASIKTVKEVEIERELAKHAVSTTQLNRRVAQVEWRQAKARLARRTVLAPTSGYIVESSLKPGEYAHKQASVAKIAEINPLFVEVFVPTKFYRHLKIGDAAKIFPEEPIGGEYIAKIAIIDKVFDVASRTFGVRLNLPNENLKLPAGLRCEIIFIGNPEKS